jgi:large subunit ribosomal protein L24e
MQTTIKAMKRVGEIKARRERAFFKNRHVLYLNLPYWLILNTTQLRMAAAKAKQRAHRQKALKDVKLSSVKLHEPMAVEESPKVKEKIKILPKSRSALVHGDGRSMGMEVD